MQKSVRGIRVDGPTDHRLVAGARDRFLTESSVVDSSVAEDSAPDLRVRRMIAASWQRSRDSFVDIDRIRVPFIRDPDLDTPLHRSASLILDNLGEQLKGEPVSIILTDQAGIILDRRSPAREMANALDRVRLVPGFSYAEQFAGTNGIGTALSSGRPALVDGREHYTHELGQFACAGAPIKHPTRGKIVGLLDLTSWCTSPGAMLTALAIATATQIEQELLAQTGMRELALFSEYVRSCQQSNGPVLALNNDVVMSNNQLRRILDLAEQEALVGYAIDTMQSAPHERMRTITLPSGRTAHLRYTPIQCEDGLAGGVFRVRVDHLELEAKAGVVLSGRPAPAIVLPGLVGSGPVWSRCVSQLDSRYRAGDWIALEGEPGTGKRSLLQAAHRLHNPSALFRVFEPPTAEDFEGWLGLLGECLDRPNAFVVLVEAEKLSAEQATTVGELLSEASTDPDNHARVAMTISSEANTPLRTIFTRTVDVPSLRHHIDDLPELVAQLLAQIFKGVKLECSPQVLSQLARLNWPGNVTQLKGVLRYVVQHRRSGVIELADLPPECRTSGRRVLSPIEALARDAIINALRDKGGNATAAAKMLGMSRATIYRRIREYDIT